MHLSHQVDLLLGDNISMFDNKFFDLVVFNPPYLPHDRSTDISTDGGIFGIEKTLYWLNSSMNIIKSDGKIIFLISDLSKPFSFLGQQLDKLSSVKLRILSKTKLFFIWRCWARKLLNWSMDKTKNTKKLWQRWNSSKIWKG